MKIYDFKGFPNPTGVRIAVAKKNMTDRVTIVTVNVPAGIGFAAFVKSETPAGLQHLNAWRGRVTERPSIAAV